MIYGKEFWKLKDDVKLIIQLVGQFLLLPIFLKKVTCDVMAYNGSSSSAEQDMRRYYLQNCSLTNDVTRPAKLYFCNENFYQTIYYQSLSISKYWQAFITTLKFVWAIIASNHIRHNNKTWVFSSYSFVLQSIFIQSTNVKHIYFGINSLKTYVAIFISNQILSDFDSFLVSSNSYLYIYNRYIFAPQSTLVLCSKMQEEEATFFLKNRWLVVKNIVQWGMEDALFYQNIVKPSSFIYDIGYYSSGYWARDKFLRRIDDLQKLKAKNYRNFKEAIALEILETLIVLKENYPALNIIFYPHPHERKLIETYNMHPPFLEKLQQAGIVYGYDDKPNSVSRITECNLGIAVVSTIISDRINLGLKGLIACYPTLKENNYINNLYFGKYQHILFDNKEKLMRIIKKEFNLQ